MRATLRPEHFVAGLIVAAPLLYVFYRLVILPRKRTQPARGHGNVPWPAVPPHVGNGGR